MWLSGDQNVFGPGPCIEGYRRADRRGHYRPKRSRAPPTPFIVDASMSTLEERRTPVRAAPRLGFVSVRRPRERARAAIRHP